MILVDFMVSSGLRLSFAKARITCFVNVGYLRNDIMIPFVIMMFGLDILFI